MSVKPLEENLGGNLLDVGLGNDSFKPDTGSTSNKGRETSSSHEKPLRSPGSRHQRGRRLEGGETRIANHVSDKGPTGNKYEEFTQLSSEKQLKIQLKRAEERVKVYDRAGRRGSVVERGPKDQEVAGEGAENQLSCWERGGGS